MSVFKSGGKKQPFPRKRPNVEIVPSRAKPFEVDCQELRWWFGRPVKGDETLWAIYDPPDWTITEVTRMRAGDFTAARKLVILR